VFIAVLFRLFSSVLEEFYYVHVNTIVLWCINLDVESLVECIGGLKSTPRTGWVQRSVPKCMAEDVASHLFESSIMAGVMADYLLKKGYKINVERAMGIALLHDLGECVIGDITKVFSEKAGELKLEIEKMEGLKLLKSTSSLSELYKEWFEGESLEAFIAKLSDMVATIIQARRYSEIGYKRVGKIEEHYMGEIKRLVREKGVPELTGILEALLEKRL
jgi:putative hydrolase of HD superfamily